MHQLHHFTGEFRDWEIEREFRASMLGKVQRDSRFTLIISTLLTGMFGISDYNFVGLTPRFYQLLGVRGVMIAGCLVLAGVLYRSPALLNRPWLYSVAPLLVATGTILILALRPETLPTMLTAVVVVVVAFYLFVPNLIWGMIGTSLYMSAGFLFGVWYWTGVGPITVVTFGLLMVFANIVGYFAALRLARLQREQFALLREEQLSKLRLLEEVSRREALEKQLRLMAETDVLTGLSSRRHFMDSAQAALVAARRQGRALSLCMIDVDHFKAINDNWGHASGDKVLQEVARTCRLALRGGEPLGRFGGEEFVAALPGANLDQARRVAERLRERVAELRFDGEMAALRVTVTIGLAEVDAREAELEPALERADAALYRGKRQGRNVVVAGALAAEQG